MFDITGNMRSAALGSLIRDIILYVAGPSFEECLS